MPERSGIFVWARSRHPAGKKHHFFLFELAFTEMGFRKDVDVF